MNTLLPTAIISNEHALIMRMFNLLKKEHERIKDDKMFDAIFIDIAVDFFETYVDRNHHGKEENVLFKALEGKNISEPHQIIIDKLKKDHRYEMEHVGTLIFAKKRYVTGEKKALDEVIDIIDRLIEYYPAHVDAEEQYFKQFVDKYFNEEEREKLQNDFLAFDQTMIHERFEAIIGELEKTMAH